MAASGIGSLLAALRLVFGGRPRPVAHRDGGDHPRDRVDRAGRDASLPVALVLMVLIGFGSILMAATGNATIQLAVPDQLRGRVMSVYTTVFSASVPIGGLAMGAIASAFGVASRSRIGGVLSLARRVRRIGLGPRAAPSSASPRRRPRPRAGSAAGTARPR